MSDTKSVTGQEIVEYGCVPKTPSGFWAPAPGVEATHEKAWMDFAADMVSREKQRVVSVVPLEHGILGVVYEDINHSA